jgi:hypothetical protein
MVAALSFSRKSRSYVDFYLSVGSFVGPLGDLQTICVRDTAQRWVGSEDQVMSSGSGELSHLEKRSSDYV